jgi:ParB family chromosome partitioning protein
MKIASQILSIFGDDVQHLHGNLFRVKREKIKLAKSGLSSQDGKLVYGNPRWFINKNGIPEAKGISVEKSKMEELRNSIQDEGLENPIRLRVIEGKRSHLEVINGERRFRSIEELCERDVKCFDPATGEQKNAGEVFEWVDARIEFMDDKTALRVALKPNETSELIGDLANLNVVKVLRDSGFDDQEILKSTGKSISWLRETEKIISLDEVCLSHFHEEKINRKVAIHLSQIEDTDERLALLEKVTNTAIARHAEKKKLAQKKHEKAEEEAAIQEAAAELASKYGDEDESEVQDKSKKAKIKVKKLKEESEKIESSLPTATAKDLDNIIESKPLSAKKIQSIYIETILAILENEGFDDEGNHYGFDLGMLQGIASVLQAIVDGDKDVMEVLGTNCSIAVEGEETEEAAEEAEEISDDSSEDSSSGDDEEYEEEEEEYEDDEDEYEEEISDEEDETPIELEKEFEEAALHDEEDLD